MSIKGPEYYGFVLHNGKAHHAYVNEDNNLTLISGHGGFIVSKDEVVLIQTPSIGRVVHYQKYGTPNGEHKAEPSPAIITKVEEDGITCHLFVMNPNGCYFNKTPFSIEPKPGHWNWPPRV